MMKFESAFVHSVTLIYKVIYCKIIFTHIILPQPKLNKTFQAKMKDETSCKFIILLVNLKYSLLLKSYSNNEMN